MATAYNSIDLAPIKVFYISSVITLPPTSSRELSTLTSLRRRARRATEPAFVDEDPPTIDLTETLREVRRRIQEEGHEYPSVAPPLAPFAGGEVRRWREHWTTFVKDFMSFLLTLLIPLAPAIYIVFFEPSTYLPDWALVAWFVALIVALFRGWLRYRTHRGNQWAYDNHQLTFRDSFMRQHEEAILLSRISRIMHDQGISGRIFGYGTLIVHTTGDEEDMIIPNVPRMKEVRRGLMLNAGMNPDLFNDGKSGISVAGFLGFVATIGIGLGVLAIRDSSVNLMQYWPF